MQVSGERAFLAEGPASAEGLRWDTRLGCPRKTKEVATEAGAHIPPCTSEFFLHLGSCGSDHLLD